MAEPPSSTVSLPVDPECSLIGRVMSEIRGICSIVMTIGTSLWQGGLNLMARAEERLLGAVHGLSTGDGDFIEGASDLMRSRIDMRLGVLLVKSADEAYGTLLDIMA